MGGTRGRYHYRKIIAFKRYGFICRVQKKNESLEQFHAEVVELASKADCGDKEDEKVRDRFTAHLLNEKLSEELLVETHTHTERSVKMSNWTQKWYWTQQGIKKSLSRTFSRIWKLKHETRTNWFHKPMEEQTASRERQWKRELPNFRRNRSQQG